MVSKKKKKKKRSSPKFRVIFRPKSKIQRFFPPKIRWSPKKKKKKVFAKIQGDFSSKISQLQTFEGGLFSYGGGYFPFFTENRPQKHKKHAILDTSHTQWGGLEPPPPPPLATLLVFTYEVWAPPIQNFGYVYEFTYEQTLTVVRSDLFFGLGFGFKSLFEFVLVCPFTTLPPISFNLSNLVVGKKSAARTTPKRISN